MEYQIALARNLAITPEEFAAAWNETSAARTAAEVRLSEAKSVQFFDPTMAFTILLSVGTNVASSGLYDLLKEVVQRIREKKNAHNTPTNASTPPVIPPGTHIHIVETQKPDGTRILVVDIARP
jgi:hypothetical protein